MLLAIFVDDILSAYHAEDNAEHTEYKRAFMDEFKTSDVGQAEWMLKMRITRDRQQRTIKLDQEQYVLAVLDRFEPVTARSVHTPEDPSVQLSSADCPQDDTAAQEMQDKPYESLVGCLLYFVVSTRIDIAHAVHKLTLFTRNPGRRHWEAAKRVLAYLRATATHGLLFRGLDPSTGLSRRIVASAYCDSDYAGDKDTRRSTSGVLAFVGGNVVAWSAKRQPIVTLSSCEAEYVAMSTAVQELRWLRSLLHEIGFPVDTPSPLLCDNQAAIALSQSQPERSAARTKHIDVRYHFVKDEVASGQVLIDWVPTEDQLADLLTKALARPSFEAMRGRIMHPGGTAAIATTGRAVTTRRA